jgi:hypothetical protein
LISGDDWFTKTLLINSISRNTSLKQSLGKAVLEGNDSFSDILNQMMLNQLDDALLKDTTPNSIKPKLPPLQNRLSITSLGSLRFEPIVPQKLNDALEGKLKNMGSVFIQAGQHYNINPALLAAISMHETGNGGSAAANNKNNVAGMMGKNGLKNYASVTESIWDMAQNLAKNYLGQGIASIAKIGAMYAPVGAENDPNGLNHYWVSGVTKYFNQING